MVRPRVMKYKTLKAMAHNFSHSFVSYMNYVDEGYVIDDLRKLVFDSSEKRISIQWLPKKAYRFPKLSRRVRKSIRHYQAWLPKHIEKHRLSKEIISEMRTDLFVNKRYGLSVESYLRDDRGKEYKQRISF
jgi:hypothetical protein